MMTLNRSALVSSPDAAHNTQQVTSNDSQLPQTTMLFSSTHSPTETEMELHSVFRLLQHQSK